MPGTTGSGRSFSRARSRGSSTAPRRDAPLSKVLPNYTSELTAAGFETLFDCRADDCGEYFYVREQGIFTRTGSIEDAFVPEPPMQRYVAARLARPGEGDVYVFLFVGEST